MPRKVSSEILSIMQPHEIENLEIFLSAKKLYQEQTKIYHQARDLYYTQMAHLQSIVEPELNDTYEYIESLTPEQIETLTPQEIYANANTRVSIHKFGRMMREIGYKRTTTSTPLGVQARWRIPE